LPILQETHLVLNSRTLRYGRSGENTTGPRILPSGKDVGKISSHLLDRRLEAEELEVQVMETRKRVLGEEHPLRNLSLVSTLLHECTVPELYRSITFFVSGMQFTKIFACSSSKISKRKSLQGILDPAHDPVRVTGRVS
jgi:hypothetical protein